MHKILIIGSPGSGKSTLARKLSDKLKLPCVHLDKIFWQPGWIQTPKEEFDVIVKSELEKEKWIIDGNYNRTLPLRLKYADTVIWLNYSRLVCVWRVFKRQGKPRPDMTDGCIEKRDKDFSEFLLYTWNFPKQHNSKIKELLSQSNAEIIVIHNSKELKEFENSL